MAWRKGQSGNPSGRRPEPVPNVPINPEPVYIPVLKRRDPAVELVKLADVSKSERFKKDIWTFLFSQKYRAANIVPNASGMPKDNAETDMELLQALESQTSAKPSKSKPKPIPVDPTSSTL